MNKQLALVKQFHKKFHVPILKNPSLIPRDRSKLRHKLIKDEVKEYNNGIRENDIENIAKELADILYAVYGTILEHGLQDKIEKVFKEVHSSNMSKEYHEYKMIKGKAYKEPNITNILKNK